MRFTSSLRAVVFGASLAAASVGVAAVAQAQTSITTLYGTGVDAAGNPLAAGATDGHYAAFTYATAGTLGAVIGQAQRLNNGYDNSVYLADPSYTSQWIWATADGDLSESHPLTAFRTTFSLTGFNLSTVRIMGAMAADNHVDAVYLNGVLVDGLRSDSFTAFTDFLLASGFVTGVNTLDFYTRDDGAPAGFNVGFSSQGASGGGAVTTPEPESVALIGAGLAGVAAVARRRRPSRS